MKKIIQFTLILRLALPCTGFAAAKSEIPVYTEQKTSVLATANQPKFIIKLKSNPTTGYSWFLKEYNTHYLEPVKHEFQAAENRQRVGAPGYEVWTFKLKPAAFAVPLQTTLRFVYARPWEKSSQSTGVAFGVSTIEKK